MKRLYRQLNDRERLMVLGLAGLIAVILIQFAIINPIFSLREQAKADFERAIRLEELTEGLATPGVESEDDRRLRSIVSEQAARYNIVFNRIQTSPDGGVQMDLTNVPYTAFYAWLEGMQQEADIVVTEAYITAGDEAGALEVRLSLSRGKA